MVQTIHLLRANPVPLLSVPRYGPKIVIHKIERTVHGNGIDIKVYGDMKIASGEYVYAHELKLNTLQVLVLTCQQPRNTGTGHIAQKNIFSPGTYDNYASIEVYNDAGVWQGPGTAPGPDGSIILNFIAEGE